jgi:AraC-like DNA-binding protein
MFEIDIFLSYIDVMSDFFQYFNPPGPRSYPQDLGIFSGGVYYNLIIQTFTLSERAKFHPVSSEHSHNVFHIVFYTAENVPNKFLLDGGEERSEAGALVITAPGTPHSFAPRTAAVPYTYHEITFTLESPHSGEIFQGPFGEILGLLRGAPEASVPLKTVLSKSGAAAVEFLYKKLAEKIADVSGGDLSPVYRTLSEMLHLLSDKFYAPAADTQTGKDSPVRAALDYIEKNYTAAPSLEMIAKAAGVSPEHLCRIFKDKHGETPVLRANRLRAAAAERMLRFSDIPIAEISSRLGYADVYSFSKAFKKLSGKTPGAVRRERQKQPPSA